MMSSRFTRLTVAMLVSLGALGASRTAHAQSMTCANDTDCGKGFSCQTVGASACPAIACARGEECDIPICDPQIIKECEPGPCNTDSDCATGMVCFTDSAVSCPPVEVAPSCPKDALCAEPAVVDAGACTTMTSKSCVPKYDLPCHVDSDCGDGFTCVPDTATECSGGGSAGSAGSGSTPPVPPVVQTPTCTTTTLSTSSCQAKSMPCATSNDCPSTWSCSAGNVSNIACAGPALAVDAGSVAPICDPGPPAQMLCAPPYAYLGLGTEGSGFASGSPTSAGSGDAAVVPGLESAPSASAGNSPPNAAGGGGCQLGGGGATGGGPSLLALLGLVGLVRRRSR
jgi:Cys-rich repeat protein